MTNNCSAVIRSCHEITLKTHKCRTFLMGGASWFERFKYKADSIFVRPMRFHDKVNSTAQKWLWSKFIQTCFATCLLQFTLRFVSFHHPTDYDRMTRNFDSGKNQNSFAWKLEQINQYRKPWWNLQKNTKYHRLYKKINYIFW